MNNILQTTTVRGLTTSLTLGSVVLELFNLAEVLDLNFSNASITPLNPSSSIVFSFVKIAKIKIVLLKFSMVMVIKFIHLKD